MRRKHFGVILFALVFVLNCGCAHESGEEAGRTVNSISNNVEITEGQIEKNEEAQADVAEIVSPDKPKREYVLPKRFKQLLDEYEEEDESFLPRLPLLNTVGLCDYSDPIYLNNSINIALPLTAETKCSDVFCEHSESQSYYITKELGSYKCDWQWSNIREDHSGMALERSKDVEHVLDDSFLIGNPDDMVVFKPTYGKGNKANGFANLEGLYFETYKELENDLTLKEAFDKGLYFYKLRLADSSFKGLETEEENLSGDTLLMYLSDNFGKPSFILSKEYDSMVEPTIRSSEQMKWENEYALFYETQDRRFIVELDFTDIASMTNYNSLMVGGFANVDTMLVWARPLFEDLCEECAEEENWKVYKFDDWYENSTPEAYTGGNASKFWNAEKEQPEESKMSVSSIDETEKSYLVADETVGLPTDMSENPYRVMLNNTGLLMDEGIQLAALDYLEPYLNEYFNYYLDNGTNYGAKYVEGTFVPDLNFPTFHIYIEELDLDIECVYITSKEYYRFTSRFNPNGE